MAGAPVSKTVIRKIKEVLPEGEIYTPYGATEALPVTLISGAHKINCIEARAVNGELGDLVGRAVKGVDVQIIECSDEGVKELSSRHIGEVIVRGKNISPRYLENKEATAEAKIIEDNAFWHRMGDMGYIDEQENLYFCGRKAHMVHCPERILYSVCVERIINSHAKVARSALVALNNKQVGVVVEPLPEY